MSKFLKFGVKAAVAGRMVNEYALGIEVFERNNSFDPRLDPIVRVHARRLRSKLAQYYETEGAGDAIEIQLPLRSYIPVFHRRAPPAVVPSRSPVSKSDPKVRGSIAVFPLVNLTALKEDDYFAEGLTRELTHSLAQLSEWNTISWTGRQPRPDVRKIGRQLSAQAALWGTLRKADDRLRISADLISISDGTVLWSTMYDFEAAAVIATQEQIARAICDALRLHLDHSQLGRRHRATAKAYELYLKGRYEYAKRHRPGLKKGVQYLRQAVAADSQYAASHAALAEALVLQVFWGETSPHELMPEAKREAQRALELDPASADGYMGLGLVAAMYEWDLNGADAYFRRALELAPSSAVTRTWYAVACLTPLGRRQDAVAELQKALQLDPLSLTIPHHLAFLYCSTGNPNLALDQLYESLDLEPEFALTRWSLGLAYLTKSEYQKAIEEFARAAALSSDLAHLQASLGHAYALSGDKTGATAVLDNLLKKSRTEYVPKIDLALVYLGLHEYEKAFRLLESATSERCVWLTHLNSDPRTLPVRHDPRFRQLLEAIHLPA